MTLRTVGLYGGRIPTNYPAAAVPEEYRSNAIDIDELREAARGHARTETEALELADDAALNRMYAEAKAAADAEQQAILADGGCLPWPQPAKPIEPDADAEDLDVPLAALRPETRQGFIDAFTNMTSGERRCWGRQMRRGSHATSRAEYEAWAQVCVDRANCEPALGDEPDAADGW